MEIALASILIPSNRQRRAFDTVKIADLRHSMDAIGLLHPIVLRQLPDLTFELMCGERRLRAASLDPPWPSIPYVLHRDLDEIHRKQAELEENLLRVDLSWQEKSAAIAELHRMRLQVDPQHTKGDTAQELSNANGQAPKTNLVAVSRALTLDSFRSDPHVQAARDEREAYKIATAKLQAAFAVDLAAQVAATPSEHTLIQGDCREFLPTLPPQNFDLIITDPPYGMGADSFGDAGAPHSYRDDEASAMDICLKVLTEGFRVTKDQAHLYMFCDIDWFYQLRYWAHEAGWYAWRTPLIWYKGGGSGHNPIPEIGFRRSYETLLYAIKGNRPATFLSPDVIEAPKVAGINRVGTPEHAAAKPSWLYEHLIKRSCRPGDTILDPCAGSGTVFEAAKATHTRATGIELDPDFCALAKGRM